MKEKSNNLVLFNVWGTKKGVVYKYVGYGNGYGTNPTRLFSLGNLQKLLDKNPNAVEILKDKLKSFTKKWRYGSCKISITTKFRNWKHS
ncbi:hypothetical protein NW733_04075 [Mycoplasmopsis felis]|nr:hypothetical protein [Mycoplasmopsis felis]MCU9931838.1 hypothetical protein [Mycoplasmopsis felis]